MTRNKSLIAAILASAMFASCNVPQTVIRGDGYSGEDFINIDIDEKAPPIADIKPQVQKLNRPTRPSVHKDPKSVQPPVVSKSQIDGNWVITEADGYKVDAEDNMPYIIFSDKGGRFYASNGCNVLNGSYTYAPQTGKITFGHVLTTMMLCSDTGYESAISDALTDGNSLFAKVKQVNNESVMTLTNSAGTVVMRLLRHNLEILNGQWEVTEIDDEEVSGDVFNVFFDIAEHTIHGNTGCNFFNGRIVVDPDVASSISFSQMGVTMRLCPNQEIERKMLVALESTASYRLAGNTLFLYDDTGTELMRLHKAN